MEDLELLRHITIGQYLPTGSPLHRLDARVKILGFGSLILAGALCPSSLGLLVLLLLALLLTRLAGVRLGYALGGLRPALPVLLLIAVLQLLFGWQGWGSSACHILWQAAFIKISDCSLLAVFNMALRLVAMILFTSLLTLTSAISELTSGIEALLLPLRRFGLPAHELALVFILALRFVPTLAEELEKLLKAQAARGADIRLGINPVQRTRHLLPVLIPLFLTTLQRVEGLTEAMIARGYHGSQGRTQSVRLRAKMSDWIILLATALLVSILLFTPIKTLDQFLWLGLRQVFIH
jgi:energy-coupling factor transport system permease protein